MFNFKKVMAQTAIVNVKSIQNKDSNKNQTTFKPLTQRIQSGELI